MVPVYIWTGVFGLALVIYSLIAGGHSDASAEAGGDVGGGTDAGHDASDHPMGGADAAWVLFFSFRFWTYCLASFGLLGFLMETFTDWPSPIIAGIAAVAGIVAGGTVAYTLRLAQRSSIDSNLSAHELVGSEARVMVAVRPDQAGKVRCSAKGDTVDFLALPAGDQPIPAGTAVVIVEVEGQRVRVVERSEIYG